jgi:hypothetical protein
MLEVFFAISLITFFLFYLIYSIYSLKKDSNLDSVIYYENLINNFFIINKKGILTTYLTEFDFYSIEHYVEALYPFTNREVYIYDNVYIPFFVIDDQPAVADQRLVKFHYFFPFNVNKKSIKVLNDELQDLPTKVEFNYLIGKIPYIVTSLKDYNCTYLEINNIKLNGKEINLNFVKKIKLFLNNYEIKNFSWEYSGSVIKLRINEKIETGSANAKKYLYIYITNISREDGEEPSTFVDEEGCLSLTLSGKISLNVYPSNLGTVYFNYEPIKPTDNNKYYFYLNFLANYHLNNEIIKNNNVNFDAPLKFNENRVAIIYPDNIIYGEITSNMPKDKNIKSVVLVPIYDKGIYHELNVIIYE